MVPADEEVRALQNLRPPPNPKDEAAFLKFVRALARADARRDHDAAVAEVGALNIKDTAKRIGVSRTTLYKMIEVGEIRTFTVRGMRRISLEEIRRVMAGN